MPDAVTPDAPKPKAPPRPRAPRKPKATAVAVGPLTPHGAELLRERLAQVEAWLQTVPRASALPPLAVSNPPHEGALAIVEGGPVTANGITIEIAADNWTNAARRMLRAEGFEV